MNYSIDNVNTQLNLKHANINKSQILSNKTLKLIFDKIDNTDNKISENELFVLNEIVNQYNQKKLKDKKTFINTIEKNTNAEFIKKLLDKDFNKKTFLIFSSTGENIDKHIKLINKNNIEEIIKLYNSKNGENGLQTPMNDKDGFFSHLLNENNLSVDERKNYIKYAFSQLILSANDKNIYIKDLETQFYAELNNKHEKTDGQMLDILSIQFINRLNSTPQKDTPNGKIDKTFTQGNIGDCWLIAGIRTISNIPEGKEILENNLNRQKNGDIAVTLKGVNKTYNISAKELKSANELSQGDADVRAIELAVNKYFEETYANTGKGSKHITKNKPERSFQLLLDNPDINIKFSINSKIIDKIKSGKYAGVTCRTDEGLAFGANEKGFTREIYDIHAYCILGADENFVYISDPNSPEKLKLTHDEFEDAFQEICLVKLK